MNEKLNCNKITIIFHEKFISALGKNSNKTLIALLTDKHLNLQKL